MVYGSVCSGIEAASVAWEPLGWKAAWLSEIEPFPSAVLAHRWPDVPNLGDMTKIHDNPTFLSSRIDLLVGGTPCQSFSVAGKRAGLADPRGNLALEFLRLADIAKPRWVLWENVPGVLSSDGGRAFGSFLGALVDCGYGFAYRVLNAQFFGVPQRRRRLFVVGHRGDWGPAAEVLFEQAGGSGVAEPGGKVQGERLDEVRPDAKAERVVEKAGRRLSANTGTVSRTLQARGPKRLNPGSETFITEASFNSGDTAYCLSSHGHPRINPSCETFVTEPDLRTRYLTVTEWERLMGFPVGHTRIPWKGKPAEECPDAVRYKSLGNSMAVPVMNWIGSRIESASSK
jgi:DNA (cytosine-5)-methyltransferase 1